MHLPATSNGQLAGQLARRAEEKMRRDGFKAGPSPEEGRGSVHSRGWLVRRMLLVADVAALCVSFFLTELFVGWNRPLVGEVGPTAELVSLLATLPIWVVTAKIYGLYDRDEELNNHSTADEMAGLFHVVTVGAWLVLGIAEITAVVALDYLKLATFWALAILLLVAARTIARAVAKRTRIYVQNTVILGEGDVGQRLARKILRHPEYGINLVGLVDREQEERSEGLEHLQHLGPPEELAAIVQRHDIERVIVAFSADPDEKTLPLVRSLSGLEVQTDLVPRLFEVIGTGAEIHTIEGIPAISLPPFRLSRSARLLKRATDVSASALGLLLLTPLFIAVAVLIKFDSRGGVFFRQRRIGEHERTFRIFKFRTMQIDAEEQKGQLAYLNDHARSGGDARMFKIHNDPRTTRVGRVLRRCAIDELPQLINVLKGDMSLVGPRPLIPEEHRYVDEWARRRLDLRPGMTGLWQVLGRSEIPFSEMVTLDYVYASNWSIWTDLRLLGRTIPTIVRGNGGG